MIIFRVRNVSQLLVSIALSIACFGCAGSTASKGGSVTPAVAPGITYHVPQTFVEIQAKRTDYEQNVIEEGKLKKSEPAEVTGDVTLRTVPAEQKTLDLNTGAFADGSLTVTTTPDGFLTAINASNEGKAGTFLSNIFQVIGRVLGSAVLIAARQPGDPPEKVTQPEPVECTAVGVPASIAEDAFIKKDGAPDRPDPSFLVPDPSFFGADTGTYFFVTHSRTGCDLWKELLKAKANVGAQAKALQSEESALKGTSTSSQAKTIDDRIRHAETVLRRFQATEAQRTTAFDTALADFKKNFGMTPKTVRTVEKRESFTISEIPPLELFRALDKTSLATAFQPKHQRMAAMLDAGLVLAVIDVPPAAAGAIQCGNNDVAYRDPRVIRLAVFRAEKGRDFKKEDERSVTVFDGDVRCAKIEHSAFANRALVMEFGDFGVPKKLQRTNSSVAAAASGAVGSALASLTDTYAASLEKVIAIQASRRTIAQSDLADEIARLTKQKELVDAEVAFQGANASKDLLLQQKLAEQRLALLQKELDLKKFEQGSDAQLEIASLKDRIALLEQQLALLIAQRKLDEANTP